MQNQCKLLSECAELLKGIQKINFKKENNKNQNKQLQTGKKMEMSKCK